MSDDVSHLEVEAAEADGITILLLSSLPLLWTETSSEDVSGKHAQCWGVVYTSSTSLELTLNTLPAPHPNCNCSGSLDG